MSGGRLEASDSVIDLHSSSNTCWQGLHSPPGCDLDHRFPRSGAFEGWARSFPFKQRAPPKQWSTKPRSESNRALRFGLEGYIHVSAIRQCDQRTINPSELVLNPNFPKQMLRSGY
jgi:hypothetical protein